MWSGASQLDAIFHCRRRDGVAEAARNAMKRSEANKVATPHGNSQAARNECGAERANSTRFGKPDFTGELPDRKPRGAQHEAQTLFVAAKVIGAGTAGMGERIHDTAFFTARPKNERGLLLHYPIGGSGKPEKR